MSGRYLLDTNVAVALLNGEPAAAARLADAAEVFLPTVVLGELYFGAMKSGRPDANASRVSDFAATSILLGVDAETARRYGLLRVDLQRKGRPIPENDLWIAAIALRHGLVLATRDSHFEHVETLELDAWQAPA
jgi:tRNA(fMet)-specific endonuclease VapC